MYQIKNEVIEGWEKRHLQGIEAIGCTFDNCSIRLPKKPGNWNLIRDCRAIRCSKVGVFLRGTAIENCELDTIVSGSRMPARFEVCVFNRVTVKGRVTMFFLEPECRSDMWLQARRARLQRKWDAAMREYYAKVDWALDVREAQFTSAGKLLGVPGELVKRDPERQILIKREKLVDGAWQSLSLDWSQFSIEDFLERSTFESVVLVGSSVKKYRQRDLDEFNRLRNLGIAEPD